MQGDFTLAELSIGLLDSGWTSNKMNWLQLCYLDSSIRVFKWMHYYGDCFIRVSRWSLSIGGCLLFYNSPIFNAILLSVGKGYLIFLFHLHSNFQLIAPSSLCNIARNSWFFNHPKSIARFYQGWVKHYIFYCLLRNWFLTTKKHSSDV